MAKTIIPKDLKPTAEQTQLLHLAIQRIESLLGDFIDMGDNHGSNSGIIGRAALDTVPVLSRIADGNIPDEADEDVGFDVFSLPSLIDGARSVSDAKPAGIAVMNVAYCIADALATVLCEMPHPAPVLFDALQEALAEGVNMSANSDEVDNLRAIRHALHIGLESFGEIERVTGEHETLEAIGQAPAKALKPLHPTGSANTVGIFATALRTLEIMEMDARNEVPA